MTTTTPTTTDFRMLTGYAAAQIVNAELTELGLDNIPAQMIYNYIGQKRIPSTTNDKGKRVVSELDLATWFQGYLDRKATLAQKKASKLAAVVTPTESE